MISTIIRLRRDNDYNYARIKDTFVPANGEICLVDTATAGLRVICGDGVSTFGQLNFIDDYLKVGYYRSGTFYTDSSYAHKLNAYSNCLYIDKPNNQLFFFNGEAYEKIGAGSLPHANATTPGIMKLYDSVGQNIDGTMTQKAITDELDDKVEIALNESEETLIFTI